LYQLKVNVTNCLVVRLGQSKNIFFLIFSFPDFFFFVYFFFSPKASAPVATKAPNQFHPQLHP